MTHFQQIQTQFVSAIRHPEHLNHWPKSMHKRLHVYRELLYNNISSFINTVFPVTASMLPTPVWEALIADFFANATCTSPFFYDISLQFKDFVATQASSSANTLALTTYPWVNELLHFEWTELYVEMGGENELDVPKSNHPLAPSAPFWVLAYQWPVHEWQATTNPQMLAPRVCYLLISLDTLQRFCVHEISPHTAVVADLLKTSKPDSNTSLVSTFAKQTSLDTVHCKAIVTSALSQLSTLGVLGHS